MDETGKKNNYYLPRKINLKNQLVEFVENIRLSINIGRVWLSCCVSSSFFCRYIP